MFSDREILKIKPSFIVESDLKPRKIMQLYDNSTQMELICLTDYTLLLDVQRPDS